MLLLRNCPGVVLLRANKLSNSPGLRMTPRTRCLTVQCPRCSSPLLMALTPRFGRTIVRVILLSTSSLRVCGLHLLMFILRVMLQCGTRVTNNSILSRIGLTSVLWWKKNSVLMISGQLLMTSLTSSNKIQWRNTLLHFRLSNIRFKCIVPNMMMHSSRFSGTTKAQNCQGSCHHCQDTAGCVGQRQG